MNTDKTNLIKKGITTTHQEDKGYNTNSQVTIHNCPQQTEIIYPYGTAGNAGVHSATLTFMCFNQPDNLSSINYKPDNRFKNLKPGEYICGNQETQTYIKFNENGNITIKSNAQVEITGNVVIKGQLTVSEDITALSNSSPLSLSDIKDTYNIHTHNNVNEPPTLSPNEPLENKSN